MPSRQSVKPRLDYVSFELDYVNERNKANGSRIYQREVGLSLRELRLMRFIATEPGLTLGRLIALTRTEKTIASKLITSLARRELVRRSVGADDARQISLSLTEQGLEQVRQAEPIGALMETAMRSRVSAEDLAALRRCLAQWDEAADAMVAEVELGVRRGRARRERAAARRASPAAA